MSAPTFDETQHPRGEGGKFTTKPASEASVSLADDAARPVLDPTGPGGWGSYSSELVLGRDVDITAPEEWTVPAGTKVRLRTDLTNLDEGESASDQPLRLDTVLEIDRADHTPYGSSWATLVDAQDPEPARFDALARIHDNMRTAATTTDENYPPLHKVAERQSWQTANGDQNPFPTEPPADQAPAGDPGAEDDLDDLAGAQDKVLSESWEAKVELDKKIARAGITAACAIVRKEHPDAATLTLEDNYEGGVMWSAHRADGTEIEDLDEFDDDLYEYGSYVQLDRPSTVEELVKGYDPTHVGYARSGEIEVDKHTQTVTRMTVDIDETLSRARSAKD